MLGVLGGGLGGIWGFWGCLDFGFRASGFGGLGFRGLGFGFGEFRGLAGVRRRMNGFRGFGFCVWASGSPGFRKEVCIWTLFFGTRRIGPPCRVAQVFLGMGRRQQALGASSRLAALVSVTGFLNP